MGMNEKDVGDFSKGVKRENKGKNAGITEKMTESHDFDRGVLPTPTARKWYYSMRKKKRSKVDKILKFLNSEKFAFPKQIASNCGIKHSTVKNYLREMENYGIVVREPGGMYRVAEGIYGIANEVRIQNVIIRLNGIVYPAKKRAFPIGDSKITFSGNIRASKTTVRIKCPGGMSWREWVLAKHFIEKEFNGAGVQFGSSIWENAIVTSIEFLKDEFGVGFSGSCKNISVTIKDMDGYMEKVYSKKYGIRREIRISKHISLSAVEAILSNGVMVVPIVERLERLDKSIDAISRSTALLSWEVRELRERIFKLSDLFSSNSGNENDGRKDNGKDGGNGFSAGGVGE